MVPIYLIKVISMKADRRHIFPKKALSIEGVKTKTLIIAIIHGQESLQVVYNNRQLIFYQRCFDNRNFLQIFFDIFKNSCKKKLSATK